jgi:hypothetical protein
MISLTLGSETNKEGTLVKAATVRRLLHGSGPEIGDIDLPPISKAVAIQNRLKREELKQEEWQREKRTARYPSRVPEGLEQL